MHIFSNQIFHYTRRNTPKRVTSWRDHLRVPALTGNTAPFEESLQRWRAISNTVQDLTGPRFEPLTFRSRDECVTARPTGRFFVFFTSITFGRRNAAKKKKPEKAF